MNIKRAERKELDALSKDIFGSSSRWQKFVNIGYDELVTEDVEEMVPPAKEGDEPTKQIVKKPVLVDGAQKYVRKFHTIESVLEFMVEQKKQLDFIRAQIAKQREEFMAKLEADRDAQKAKLDADKLAKQVQSFVSGSAT